MAELDQNIEAPELDQEDPIPKPKGYLSEVNKSKLDSIVLKMMNNNESEAAIQAVVDDFKKSYTAPEPKAFQINLSQPTFKSTPAPTATKEFTGSNEVNTSGQFVNLGNQDPYALTKLRKKASSAKAKLDVELHGNDTQYEVKLREFRRDAFTMDDLKNEAKQKGYIIPVGHEKEYLKLAKQRQYDAPVSALDVSDMKTGTILSESASRNFLKELGNPELQKQAYYVDAYNHAAEDEDGLRRVPKIENNAKLVGKGIYQYDLVNKVLVNPQNFLGSLFTGRDELNKSFDLYEYLKSKPDAAIFDRLNHEMTTDVDEPIPVPSGKISEIGRMMGGQPIKGLVTGGITAAAVSLLGAPESAPEAFNLVNSGVSAVDMYKIAYANSVRANYPQFLNQGFSEQEALNKARSLAEDQANTDAAITAAMSYGASKLAFKPTGVTMNTLKKSLGSALTQLGEVGAKKTLEGLGVGAIGGVGQVIKNLEAQNAGLQVETTAGAKDQVEAGVLLTAMTHVMARSPELLKKSTYTKAANAVLRFPAEMVDRSIDSQVDAGHITPEQAQIAKDNINEARTIDQSIPKNLPGPDRTKIGDRIRDRLELKKQLEETDEAYHPEIKEKIKGINESIVKISSGAEREELQKLITKEVNDGNVHASAAEILMNANEKELGQHMEDIAGLANNPATEEMAVQAFGKAIVDKAKELHPKEIIQSPENITENASNVRSDQGQVPLTGDGPEGIQESSSSNLQQPQGAAPLDAETGQQAGGNAGAEEGVAQSEKMRRDFMEGGIPPDMMGLPFTPEEGDVTRLAHGDTEALYSRLGMPDRVPRATKEDLTLEKEADALIKSGYDFEGKADRVLSGRDKSFTDAEQVAFAKMVGSLNVKLEGLEPNSPEFNTIYDTIDRLSRASDKVGSEEGAAFRARRMFVLNDQTLSNYIKTATEANLDVPLTEAQMSAVKAKFDDIKASRDAYRARLEKVAADNARLKAEGAVEKVKAESKKPKSAKTKKTDEDYIKERKDIVEQMRKDLLKTAKGDGGTLATIPGAPQLIAIAPHVSKLVKSLIEQGVDKLEDIVKNVHEQIKELIPQIKEKDIHDIIAGEYSKKPTKSQIREKIENIQIQARLVNRLEKLTAGQKPGKRTPITRTAEIEDLRRQISDLHKEQSAAAKQPKTKSTPEQSALQALKARYKKQTEELQAKIDKGDFSPEEKQPLELDKEARDLKDTYIKKRIEWQKAIANDKFRNRSTSKKGQDLALEILGIPRTIMASMDLSAPLRQGLILTASHPMVASKAFVESIRQAASPQRFDRWLFDLKESPFYKDVIEKSGLYIADPNNLHLSAKEEAYMSNLAEKIPVVGDALKFKVGDKKVSVPGLGLISKSERAYVSYLNKMRVDVFSMYAKSLIDDHGITPQNRPDIFEALGTYINSATGRGELGDLERSAPVLNALFFSPRLIASRVNMLNPVFYASLPKQVRNMALIDMAKMIGLGTTTVALLSLVKGVSVEKNPISPDFGKVKAGNTRWDTWGGFQQYIRLASQMLSGYEKKSSGNIVPLGTKRNENTKADKFFSFFRGKLSPVPSLAVDYLTGKTATGEDVELTSEAREHLLPMITNDIGDAWKEQGPMSMVYTGIPSLLGVGTTTYKEKEPKSVSGGHGHAQKHISKIKKSNK